MDWTFSLSASWSCCLLLCCLTERVEAAVQLYKEGQVTLGRAAEIAGLTRWEFRDLLADRGVMVEVETAPAEEMEEKIKTLIDRSEHDPR
jgi:hypothetical protein